MNGDAFTYRLNVLELAIAAMIATIRQGTNEAAGVENRRDGATPGEEWDTHWRGAKAEIAFAQLYNLAPDLTYMPRRGGVDFHTNAGTTVDVKSTDRPEGNLIARNDAPGEAAVYVLALVDGSDVTLKGYAMAEELFDRSNMRTLYAGGPLTYFVARDQLHPMPGREEKET